MPEHHSLATDDLKGAISRILKTWGLVFELLQDICCCKGETSELSSKPTLCIFCHPVDKLNWFIGSKRQTLLSALQHVAQHLVAQGFSTYWAVRPEMLFLLLHNILHCSAAFPVFIFDGTSQLTGSPSFFTLVKDVRLPDVFILCLSVKQARFDVSTKACYINESTFTIYV